MKHFSPSLSLCFSTIALLFAWVSCDTKASRLLRRSAIHEENGQTKSFPWEKTETEFGLRPDLGNLVDTLEVDPFWTRVLQQSMSMPPVDPSTTEPSPSPTVDNSNRCTELLTCNDDGSFTPATNITARTRIACCVELESKGQTATVCPPALFVEEVLLFNENNVCGDCPSAPTLAPVNNPTPAPTTAQNTTKPTDAPTGSPTFDLSQCDPFILCANQTGVEFCIKDPDRDLNFDACVPLESLSRFFPFGDCGECPTPSPTEAPTNAPSRAIESCEDEVIRCNTFLPNSNPEQGVRVCVALESRLIDLCVDEDNLGLFLPENDCGFCPTDPPTAGPTLVPSRAPSDSPTGAPILGSLAPTANPTTQNETDVPTEAPAIDPSKAPTNSPTAAPTFECDPSVECGVGGIIICLPRSRDQPAAIEITVCAPKDFLQDILEAGGTCGACDTDSPTVAPSATPSISRMPTASPTLEPTNAPTASPTESPTPSPTVTPTNSPTNVPTGQLDGCDPFFECVEDGSAVWFCFEEKTFCLDKEFVQIGISLGGECCNKPTALPSSSPTEAPSTNPTAAPTSGPSGSPTVVVTADPTDMPTISPTGSPTLPSATARPTSDPSASPTLLPTASPTAPPTKFPSGSPTSAPSSSPTSLEDVCEEVPEFCAEDSIFFCFNDETLCLPIDLVAPALEAGGFCGKCPPMPTASPTSQPTDAPTLSPTESPTPSPTNAPTSSPTIKCAPAESCPSSNGPGLFFCLLDFEDLPPTTICLSEEDIQEALELNIGECGVCPTSSPTASPTSQPTEAAIVEPTLAPTEVCGGFAFKCGTSLFLCGNLDENTLCNHGKYEIEPISDEECEALQEAIENGVGCQTKCPNNKDISNYGIYGCDSAFKCDCDGRNCEECQLNFVEKYDDGCGGNLEICEDTSPPSYTFCGRQGNEEGEFCAWPEVIPLILTAYPESTCGRC